MVDQTVSAEWERILCLILGAEKGRPFSKLPTVRSDPAHRRIDLPYALASVIVVREHLRLDAGEQVHHKHLAEAFDSIVRCFGMTCGGGPVLTMFTDGVARDLRRLMDHGGTSDAPLRKDVFGPL